MPARSVSWCVRRRRALPVVTADDDTVVLDLLTGERDQALFDATRLRNQIHSLLMQIDPEYSLHLPTLKSKAGLAALHTYVAPDDQPLQVERAASVRRLAQRLQLAVDQAAALAIQIKSLVGTRFEPLTRMCGVDLLTAGALTGILGPGRRFSTDAQLAAYAGAAPLEASSAGLIRHRLNRGGNRRLNAILYRIVLTQAHHLEEARTYLESPSSRGQEPARSDASPQAFRHPRDLAQLAGLRFTCLQTGPRRRRSTHRSVGAGGTVIMRGTEKGGRSASTRSGRNYLLPAYAMQRAQASEHPPVRRLRPWSTDRQNAYSQMVNELDEESIC